MKKNPLTTHLFKLTLAIHMLSAFRKCMHILCVVQFMPKKSLPPNCEMSLPKTRFWNVSLLHRVNFFFQWCSYSMMNGSHQNITSLVSRRISRAKLLCRTTNVSVRDYVMWSRSLKGSFINQPCRHVGGRGVAKCPYCNISLIYYLKWSTKGIGVSTWFMDNS